MAGTRAGDTAPTLVVSAVAVGTQAEGTVSKRRTSFPGQSLGYLPPPPTVAMPWDRDTAVPGAAAVAHSDLVSDPVPAYTVVVDRAEGL